MKTQAYRIGLGVAAALSLATIVWAEDLPRITHDWPAYNGPNGTYADQSKVPLLDDLSQAKLAWLSDHPDMGYGAPPLTTAETPSRSTVTVGFRGDGSGIFADATLPTLDLKNGKGVAWRSELPAADWHQITDASPVLAGDRVIITFGNDHGAGDQQVAAYDLALADGKVTLTEAWRGAALLPNSTPEKPVKRGFSRISPLVVGELLITPVPGNALFVHRLKDGKLLDPVPGVAIDGQPHTFWPNPILVGQTVVIPEAWGKLTLLKLGGTSFQVQSVEAVLTHEGRRPSGPRMGASPLAWGSTLFLRTDKELIALR